MNDSFSKKIRGIYGWTVKDGKVVPPKHDLPDKVKERADYFSEMLEDGMTMMGCMECIFADEKPTDYDWGATKDWLPKSKEFDEWVGVSLSLAQCEMFIYLLFGNKEVSNDK